MDLIRSIENTGNVSVYQNQKVQLAPEQNLSTRTRDNAMPRKMVMCPLHFRHSINGLLSMPLHLPP